MYIFTNLYSILVGIYLVIIVYILLSIIKWVFINV
uniref:Uncharacterized protein n=1 Tax=Podoviridae sp. ct8Lf7 TaxID=2827723 RepID=A0A8S5S1U2_9CAUD|nr:MAG TPA: hypothetical protein [Podoviridae sp. ct8Lf7]